ncbi:MAG TPA: M56 family metallopeptidase [Steroidobacteraceae bacterium]|nr:M56 family metallopeptidase [Steroidobacteraceae bacterium]
MQALLNHLWQSTLCVGAVWLLTLALRANAARVRYWLWFSASLKLLVPFALLVTLGARLSVDAAPASARAPLAAPFISAAPALFTAGKVATPFGNGQILATPHAAAQLNVTLLLGVWLAGIAVLAWMWIARWLRLRSLIRCAERLPARAPIPVLVCRSRLEPCLIGIRRPVLLLPDGLPARLTAAELDAILAHELCHLRRQDNLLALIQMIVAALFWFYPLIWWIGARLLQERERACDEAVLASGTDGPTYAQSLLKVCRYCLRLPLACASGVSGSQLAQRTHALVDGTTAIPLSNARRLALTGLTALAIFVPIAFGMLPSPAVQAMPGTSDIPTPAQIAQHRYEEAQPRTAIVAERSKFDRFIGDYRLPQGSIEHIFRTGSQYEAQVTGRAAIEVYPDSDSEFFSVAEPMQISFSYARDGNVNGLTVHQSGLEYYATRVSSAAARSTEASIRQHIASNQPSSGTEAFVRHMIDVLENGAPVDYSRLSANLAAMVQIQLQLSRHIIGTEGTLQSLRFKGITPDGMDVYDATFQHGHLEWRCAPVQPDGKVYELAMLSSVQ